MTANVVVPNTVKSVAAIVNQSIKKKMLVDGNYEITRVVPTDKTSGGRNITVTVRVDLAANAPALPIAGTDRYSTRDIYLKRIHVRDIFECLKTPKNELGQYHVAATTVAEFIEELGLGATEDEFHINKVGDVYVVSAATDSIGYCGKATITPDFEPADGGSDDDDEGSNVPAKPPVVQIAGPETVEVDGEAQFTITEDLSDLQDATFTWAATRGTIDSTGAYLAPEEAGVDTISFTITNGGGTTRSSREVTIVEGN